MKYAYKKAVLDNGIKVVASPMAAMRSVALGIWIKVGGRYESSELKGISHYLEHLLFKGSRNYSCRSIKESIEGVGGSLNGFTSEELTCYLVKIPSRHLELAVDILSDMVINPLLLGDDIEKERTVILEELKMYKDLPQSYVYDLLDELLWPGQPLGMAIIGSIDSVGRINRENLYSHRQEYYVPGNIVVSACGNLDYGKLTKRLEKIFSGVEKKEEGFFVPVKEEQDKPKLNLFAKDTEQTHLVLGFHGFKRDHPLRHALGMLNIILGANMSSRLFNEVRENKGLAYEIGTLVKRFHDTGAFIVHAGIDNSKVTEAIKLILQELGKIRDTQVTDDEFKRAKEFYLGQLELALEDTLDHMLWIGESQSTLDKVYTLEEVVKEVNKVKRQDIAEVARAVFQDKKLNLALIGPLKDKEQTIYNQLSLS